ncbi:btk-binding protein-related [Anaeramoeba flamelloides]|uniref:Btk-binding protein-related n=1 Tax=Anaeramoeba flamelloides TaxID=1746091 RepID=A0AAV8ACH5_9EUKA|nr:btk-binding protein-related [Anaeramoeba flamelloides]
MENTIYFSCYKGFYNFLLTESSKLPNWCKLDKVKKLSKIKKIEISKKEREMLILKNKKQFLYLQENGNKKELLLTKHCTNKNAISDIIGRSNHFIILTPAGEVLSLNKNTNKTSSEKNVDEDEGMFKKQEEIVLKDPKNIFSISKVSFFKRKKLTVKSLHAGSSSVFFHCSNNKLYGYGKNIYGETNFKNDLNNPVFIQSNVIKFFSNCESDCYFFIKKIYSKKDKNKFIYILKSFGRNSEGQLGIENNSDQNTITKVLKIRDINEIKKIRDFGVSNILDIKSGYFHSILLSKNGQVYSCGNKKGSGFVNSSKGPNIFTILPYFKNINIIQIYCGFKNTICMSQEFELYGWGFDKCEYPHEPNKLYQSWEHPQKVTLPTNFQIISQEKFRVVLQNHLFIIYNRSKEKSTLRKDLKIFFKLQKYCDSEITSNEIKVPIHKLLVEHRTGLKIEEINKAFSENKFNKKEINAFLKWVYYNKMKGKKLLIKEIFGALNMTYPPKNSIEKDLLKLFYNKKSKDFYIMINDPPKIVKEKGYDDSDENQEEEFESIPVHKFILLARSGLFREMFDNLNENEKNIRQIKDYTGKSLESLQIIIKYFYTGAIKLDADTDLEFTKEDLEDAVEYYQLNDQCNFKTQLTNIL